VVALDPVVGVPLGVVPRRRQHLLQDHRVGRRLISHDLARHGPGRADGPRKESTGRPQITPWRDEHVDDLPELVDRPVDVAPTASHLHRGLICLPAIPDRVPAGPGRLDQERCEPHDPAGDGDVVNLDAALSEQLFDVAVEETNAKASADRQHDHISSEAETGQGTTCNGIGADAASSHIPSLAARIRSEQMQQCPIKT
jgi:hypothetical protein